jgi:hypothetical protein
VTSTSLLVSATQTRTEPASTTFALTYRFAPLWQGIVDDDTVAALGDVVPESVYAVLEAGHVADAVAAYVSDVQAPFQLDVESYHETVGSSGVLTGVRADGDPVWVHASACGTTAGYWYLSAVTLRYASNGRSFAVIVANLVSWRGTWYVGRFGSNSDVVGSSAVLTQAPGSGSDSCPVAA